MKSARADHVNLYGLKPTSDRMAEMLKGPEQGYHDKCRKHIQEKMRQIRKRKIELGMETGSKARASDGALRVISERDIEAARCMEE